MNDVKIDPDKLAAARRRIIEESRIEEMEERPPRDIRGGMRKRTCGEPFRLNRERPAIVTFSIAGELQSRAKIRASQSKDEPASYDGEILAETSVRGAASVTVCVPAGTWLWVDANTAARHLVEIHTWHWCFENE